MLAKAVFAALVLPGMVAVVIPCAIGHYDLWTVTGTPLGWLPLSLGIVLLLRCIRDFYVSGSGTLAHWTPPTRLVRTGLYRFTRNPMYLAVGIVLIGQALIHGSLLIIVYACLVLAAFAFHVRLVEEPWLARNFPDQWRRYSQDVPRWAIRYPSRRNIQK